MSSETLECSAVAERLIAGERPAPGSLLADHVGSCLMCFRTASDLKTLPQLRRQMLELAGQASDPGEAFWASFPAQVTTAWETSTRQAALVESEVELGWSDRWRQRAQASWERSVAWLRMPLTAALGGALCAAAIIVSVTHPWTGNGGVLGRAVAVEEQGANGAVAD